MIPFGRAVERAALPSESSIYMLMNYIGFASLVAPQPSYSVHSPAARESARCREWCKHMNPWNPGLQKINHEHPDWMEWCVLCLSGWIPVLSGYNLLKITRSPGRARHGHCGHPVPHAAGLLHRVCRRNVCCVCHAGTSPTKPWEVLSGWRLGRFRYPDMHDDLKGLRLCITCPENIPCCLLLPFSTS